MTNKYIIKYSSKFSTGYVARISANGRFTGVPWQSSAPQYTSKIADQRLEKLRADPKNINVIFEKVAVTC